MYLKKHPRVTEGYKKMILGFVIVAVVLVVIIIYFSARRAVITITPKATPVETNFVVDVVMDGGLNSANSLPGILLETIQEGTKSGVATGSKALSGNTIGQVKLINKRAEAQTLVKTTRLLAPNGILLRLSNQVNIPANSEISVAVYPDDASAFTELAPTEFIIPGLHQALQDKVYAESQSTLKSASSGIKIIKAEDIALTKEALTKDLAAAALKEFAGRTPTDAYYPVVVEQKELTNVVADAAGAEKDQVSVKLGIKFTIVGLDKAAIVALSEERLKSAVNDEQALWKIDFDKTNYRVQSFDAQKKIANLQVHAEGQSVIKVDNPILDKEKLSGLSPKAVQLYLSNFEDVESVNVALSPFWVKKIPSWKDRVEIVIANPQ